MIARLDCSHGHSPCLACRLAVCPCRVNRYTSHSYYAAKKLFEDLPKDKVGRHDHASVRAVPQRARQSIGGRARSDPQASTCCLPACRPALGVCPCQDRVDSRLKATHEHEATSLADGPRSAAFVATIGTQVGRPP